MFCRMPAFIQSPNNRFWVSGRRLPVNKIITVYEYNKLVSGLEDALLDNRVLYYNKEKSQALSVGNYRQLPARLDQMKASDFEENIQQFWNVVNYKNNVENVKKRHHGLAELRIPNRTSLF